MSVIELFYMFKNLNAKKPRILKFIIDFVFIHEFILESCKSEVSFRENSLQLVTINLVERLSSNNQISLDVIL